MIDLIKFSYTFIFLYQCFIALKLLSYQCFSKLAGFFLSMILFDLLVLHSLVSHSSISILFHSTPHSYFEEHLLMLHSNSSIPKFIHFGFQQCHEVHEFGPHKTW